MLELKNVIPNFQRFKVLVVGDNVLDRRAIRQQLQTLGLVNVREAEDGDDALRRLMAEDMNLVISEWEMPLMDGLSLLKRIRGDENLKPLPFLLLIDHEIGDKLFPDDEHRLEDTLLKPVRPHTLEDKMVEILFRNLRPTPFDRHLQAAGGALARNDFPRAHRELDRANELRPRDPLVPYFRRLVFEAEGRPEEARSALEQARQVFSTTVLGPREAERMMKAGRSLLAEGREAEAGAAFREALEMDPEHPGRRREIGEAFLRHGFSLEAEEVFKEALAHDPEDVILYNSLGLALRKQRKMDEAIEYYQKAIELDAYEENLRYNMAKAQLAAGRRDPAIRSLEKAVEIQPEFREAKELLARLTGVRG